MTERMWGLLAPMGVAGTLLAALIGLRWDAGISVGILGGGAWNLANLWCFARALPVWLGSSPSRRRAVGWLLVKFPLLYAAAIGLLLIPSVSPVGFAIGFLVVMLTAIVAWLITPLSDSGPQALPHVR